jgi:hypothetical protein
MSQTRLHERIAEAIRKSRVVLKAVKEKILHAAYVASASEAMTPELRTALIPAAQATVLEEQEEFALRGILLFQSLLERVKTDANHIDLAFLLAKRPQFKIPEYADFFREAGCPPDNLDPTTAMSAVRRVAATVS